MTQIVVHPSGAECAALTRELSEIMFRYPWQVAVAVLPALTAAVAVELGVPAAVIVAAMAEARRQIIKAGGRSGFELRWAQAAGRA